MSNTQKLIKAIADDLAIVPNEIMVMKLHTINMMLEKISSYSHPETALAAFGEEEDADA